mgnify:FL=1
MALTRSAVETVVTRRVGSLLEEAGLSAAAPNPHLADPIAWALRGLGYNVASITDVTDADLLPVGAAHVDALLDLAELRALESVAGNLLAVDVEVGPVSEKRSSLGEHVTGLIADRRKGAQARWGSILAQPLEETGGPVRLLAL